MEFYSKDIQILRQSQMKMAHKFLKDKDVDVSLKELIRVTDVFVELCLRPMDADLKEKVSNLDKWIEKKKNGTTTPE